MEISTDSKELKDATKTAEVLIVCDLGYFRVPAEFRAKYGSPNRYPEPIAYHKETPDGKVLLTYVWDTRELEKSRDRESRITKAKAKRKGIGVLDKNEV